MVELTRINGKKVTINALLIETVEQTPDTIITLTTGKKVIVLESIPDVVNSVQTYLRQIGSIRVAVKNTVTEES